LRWCDVNGNLKDRFPNAVEEMRVGPLEVGVQKLASNQAVLPWLQDHGSERLSKNRSEETGR